MEKKRMIFSIFLQIIADTLLISIPSFIFLVDDTFNYTFVPSTQSYEVKVDLRRAFIYSGIVIVMNLGQCFLREHAEKLAINSKFKVEQGIRILLFKKLTEAESTALDSIQPKLLSNILFFKLDPLLDFITSFPSIIAGPISTMVCIYFVFLSTKLLFFPIALVVFLLLQLALFVFFNNRGIKSKKEYGDVNDKQTSKIEEFFTNVNNIQCNSMGECFKGQLQSYRNQNLKNLEKNQMASAINDAMLLLMAYIFAAMSVAVYHYFNLGDQLPVDIIRILILQLSPLVVPFKAVSETYYKYRIFLESFNQVARFMDTLPVVDTNRAIGGDELNTAFGMVDATNCTYTKTGKDVDEIASLFQSEETGSQKIEKPKIVLFRNKTGSVSYELEVTSKDVLSHQKDKLKRTFTTSRSSNKTRRYNLESLTNLSFRIHPGEKVCIIGAEDSGKSDMFQALLNQLKLIEGELNIGGVVSYLDMKHPKFMRDTIRENILLGRPYEKRKYNSMVAMVGLDLGKYPLKDRTVVVEGQENLVDEDACKILLCRMLYYPSDIILLDKYFDSLSKDTQLKSYQYLVNEILDADTTVIMVTDVTEIYKCCSKVIMMKEGTVVEEGEYETLMNKREVSNGVVTESELYKFLIRGEGKVKSLNLFGRILDFNKIVVKRKLAENSVLSESDQGKGKKEEAGLEEEGKDEKEMATESKGKVKFTGDLNLRRNNKNSMSDRVAKLQREVMFNNSASFKYGFSGAKKGSGLLLFASFLLGNMGMILVTFFAAYWTQIEDSVSESYSRYLLFVILTILGYFILFLLRNIVVTPMILSNMNRLYTVLISLLISSQKDWLVKNPSTHVVYLLTKVVSIMDFETIRSFYLHNDALLLITVIILYLNYYIWAIMAVLLIFLLSYVIPTYSSFETISVKLQMASTTLKVELIELYLSALTIVPSLRYNSNASLPQTSRTTSTPSSKRSATTSCRPPTASKTTSSAGSTSV